VFEIKAVDLAVNNLNRNDLEKMLSGNLPPKGKEYPKADNSLHRYIIEKSQNRYIRDFFEQYGRYYEILFAWEDCDRNSAVLAVRQHRAILKALLAGDRLAAKKAMADHIRNNHTFLRSINPADIRITKHRIVLKS
jgi:DNA-binding FadR family transcriptional regulator